MVGNNPRTGDNPTSRCRVRIMGGAASGAYAPEVLRSLLRPWTQASTWWGLVQLITGLFTGYVATIFVVVGTASLLPMLIVFPVALIGFWLMFLIGHGMAVVERSRYLAFTDVALDDPAPPLAGTNPWRRFVARLRSPSRWREMLYLLLRLPVSALSVLMALLVWSGSIALIALPFYFSRLPDGDARFGLFTVGPGLTAWLCSLVGLAVFGYVAPWATVALAQADLAYARSLLAHGSKTEVEQTVIRLESSRVAAVDSAEAERRRIERDLHDGAQQRLIAAAMDLGVARERLISDPPAGQALVANAHEEVKAALRELRDLVRGIHPVILEDRGLDAALSAVVARMNIPVALQVSASPRPSPAVESAAYFIVCEALANVTRHSGATQAEVRIERSHDRLRVHIGDNGTGGADPTRGTGLVGLSDRVAALGGWLQINSPVGGPTGIDVEVPCGS
ncbi:sensor histidine kinase [soil metagenome]